MAVVGGDSDSYFSIKAGVIKGVNETERLCPLINGEPQVCHYNDTYDWGATVADYTNL